MPDEESERRLRQLIASEFMPILKKKHNEEMLRKAYNAVKYAAFIQGLQFSDPAASFQNAFKAEFAEMGKKLGLDLSSETNFIVDEISYDYLDLRDFTAKEFVAPPPMAEKPLGGELDNIIHKLAEDLRRETESESKLMMFGYTDPKIDALVAKFMEDLGKACGEAGVSPSKEQLEAALEREFQEAGAKLFMRHSEKFNDAYLLATKEEHIEEILLEKAEGEVAKLNFKEAYNEIKKAWDKPMEEFRQFIDSTVEGWLEKVPILDNAGKELTPFGKEEVEKNEEAFVVLNSFRQLFVGCEALAKDKKAEKSKADYLLRIFGIQKFNVSLELARIKIRNLAGASVSKFKEEFKNTINLLWFDVASPNQEAAEINTEKLNEFLFALYEASLQKANVVGDEADKLKYVREEAMLRINVGALLKCVERQLMEIANSRHERSSMERRIEEVLDKLNERVGFLLSSPAADKKWLEEFSKLLAANYNEGMRKKEDAERENKGAFALAWNRYIKCIELIRNKVLDDIAKKFPGTHGRMEKKPIKS
ncbi:MAG: hypothetical protein QXG98_00070 [Candidatus Micrarchaeia archaeon]